MAAVKKVGLVVGREWSMPPALLKAIHDRVIPAYAKLLKFFRDDYASH